MHVVCPKEKTKAIHSAMTEMNRRYGNGALMRLGDRPDIEVDTFSTGCLSLDVALGVGGYPRGRVVEVYGPEASGKTTLALHAIAEVQRRGGVAAFIDAEHALDVQYATKLGVDISGLLVAQPDNGEQALEIAEALVRSGAIDLVVVDSVAALVPKAELEGDMGDNHVGLQARLMSRAMRKLTAITSRSNSTVMFINQVRQKIGVVYGSSEVTTGGNALKFYSSVRLEIRRIGPIKDGSEIRGARTRIKVVKNKLAPPFRSVEVDILYGRGICQTSELLNLATQHGIVNRAGSWYSLGDERLGQGRESVREKLDTELDLRARIHSALLGQLGLTVAEPVQAK